MESSVGGGEENGRRRRRRRRERPRVVGRRRTGKRRRRRVEGGDMISQRDERDDNGGASRYHHAIITLSSRLSQNGYGTNRNVKSVGLKSSWKDLLINNITTIYTQSQLPHSSPLCWWPTIMSDLQHFRGGTTSSLPPQPTYQPPGCSSSAYLSATRSPAVLLLLSRLCSSAWSLVAMPISRRVC